MKNRFAIIWGFLAAISIGTVMLMLPISSPANAWRPLSDALFTACSAVCITGLTVVNPGTDLSLFGQIVLTVLVQLGCVGIMTTATFFLVLAGRRLSFSNEFTVSNAYGASGVRGFRALVLWVIISLFVFEGFGTLVLHELFEANPTPGADSAPGGLWFRAYFYAVMAFCNAGFSLHSSSLAPFGAQPLVLATMAVLVILGGFGFLVIYNLCTIQFWRRNRIKRGRLSLHARVVLVSSTILVVVGFLLFFVFEYKGSLEPFSFPEKLAVTFFQAVTPRTCGFTVVPLNETHPATRFISEVMMFIGAAPGGAGGGIKVTTFIVFVCTLISIYRGRRDVTVFQRTIPLDIVRESIVIFFFYFALVTVAMTALLATETGREGLTFETMLFEVVSAVTTTGLSCGNTTQLLSLPGRLVLMVCMFVGRLGAITVVLLIAGKEEPSSIRYPKEELVVG